MLTDKQVSNCKGTVVERMGRGFGAIEFKKQAGNVNAYFRYYRDSKPVRIKIGRYGKPVGISLAETRVKAGELARLRQEIAPTDLKLHLERKKPVGGTLEELLRAYIEDMEIRERVSTEQYLQYFERDVFKANPRLAKTKASEIESQDIVNLCAVVHNRGGVTSANRLRAALNAAFNFGLKADNDHTRAKNAPTFGLQINPVTATKINENATKAGERVLTSDEINHLWNNLGRTYSVGTGVSNFIKMCFVLAGQRPLQLLRTKWDDYDFEKRTVTIIDKKGKGNRARVHVVPLSDRAISILETIPRFFDWPFADSDEGHYHYVSINNALRRYLKANPDAERFVMRDVRRTCKNLLIDAGVDRDSRNLLQSHQLSGVDFKHYDRHSHLPEKRLAMEKYGDLLESIING